MSSPRIEDFSYLKTLASTELFLEKRMYYDGGGNLEYVAYSRVPNESEDADTWFIVKMTYSGANITRYQLPDSGIAFKYVATDRATYFS